MSLKNAEKEIIKNMEAEVNGSPNVPIKFFYKSVKDIFESEQAKRPIFKDVVYIEKFKGLGNILHKKATADDMARYKVQYQAFLDNEEQKQQGTPIDYLPMVTPAQLANLKTCNVHTIESLANANHSILNSVGFGSVELQKRAKEFLESKSADKELALKEEVAKLQEEIKKLKEVKNEPANNSTKRSRRNSNSK